MSLGKELCGGEQLLINQTNRKQNDWVMFPDVPCARRSKVRFCGASVVIEYQAQGHLRSADTR